MYLLIMSLGRWDLYYGLFLGEATVQAPRRGIEDVPLAENSWVGLLA